MFEALLGRVAGVGLACLGVFAACGGPAGLGSRGEQCFRTNDCREGLVCVEHRCTNDLSDIEGSYGGPPMDPGAGGAAPAADSGAPPTMPDGSAPTGSGGTGAAGAAPDSGGPAATLDGG